MKKNALNLVVAIALSGIAFSANAAAYAYSITNLGSSDYRQLSALDINNNGQVVGNYWKTNGDSGSYLWTNGLILEIGNSSVGGISDNGNVAGVAYTSDPSTPYIATVWNNGTATNLGLQGQTTVAYGVNNSGNAVGYDINAGYTNAVVWSGSAMNVIGQGVAQSINNKGAVTGYLNINNPQAFLYNQGFVSLLPSYSVGQDINQQSTIAGGYRLGSFMRAFTWDGSSFNDLGTLSSGIGEYGETYAFGINDDGNVVGSWTNNVVINDGGASFLSDYGAFLYDETGIHDLNSMVDPQLGWNFYEARGINNAGQIIVNGIFNGISTSAILTPVPEPETYTMMLIGMGILGLMAWRRKNT
jgi:probable HAF family extracellular repeat protein